MRRLTRDRQWLESFQYSCMVFDSVMGMNLDEEAYISSQTIKYGSCDNASGLNDVAEKCGGWWVRLLEEKDPEVCSAMFPWFAGIRPDYRHFIQGILFEPDWWDENHQRQMLSVMEEWLRQDDWAGDEWPRIREQLLMARIAILSRLHMSREQIRQDLSQFGHSAVICDWEIQDLEVSGDLQSAIALALRCRNEAENEEIKRKYSTILCDLYGKNKQIPELREELKNLVFSGGEAGLTAVRRLRAICWNTGWPDLFEKILNHPGWQDQRLELLALDGQYDRLSFAIEKAKDLSLLQKYEGPLRRWSAEEVCDLYEKLLQEQVKHGARTRKAYMELVGYLKGLADCPGGRGVAEYLVESWREDYPNRRVLLEELRKAGF